MTSDNLAPAEDIAALLGCSLRTVRALAHSGDLRAAKVGRGYVYDLDDAKQWLEQQMNRPPLRQRRRRAS